MCRLKAEMRGISALQISQTNGPFLLSALTGAVVLHVQKRSCCVFAAKTKVPQMDKQKTG